MAACPYATCLQEGIVARWKDTGMEVTDVIELGREAWENFTQGTEREWLETNGLGGWAFSTVLGANTRFYHGLLVAALQPPVERVLLLAKLAETLYVDDQPYRLDANAWASGTIEEESRMHLRGFALGPLPTFTYTIGDVTVTKTIFMRHGHNTTAVRYQVAAGDPGRRLRLELRPLVTHRTIHGVQRGVSPWAQAVSGPGSVAPLEVRMQASSEATPLHLCASSGSYQVTNNPVLGIYYPYEVLRGESTVDDLLESGCLRADLHAGDTFTFVASAEQLDAWDPSGWQSLEVARRQELLQRAAATAPMHQALALAADQFLVHRASTNTQTVIAGYPWFTDWGRDTMIALPGLTLATGRPEVARELLLTFARYEQDGLIPNVFPDEGAAPLYNTADASLWYFQAVRRYLAASGDSQTVQHELYPVLQRILAAHLKGTHFDIYATPDGLLHCGNPQVQVTWMDAKIGDWVVTPRDGFPVEIQALWYGALRTMHELATAFGDPEADRYAKRADQTAAAFQARFWHGAGGFLLDRLTTPGEPDATLRPNQLFALSLPHMLLDGEQAKSVVRICWQRLLTPYGLRSLSPTDPNYKGIYLGTRLQRDAAYHQGTIWGWLIGPFVRAYLAAFGRTPETLAQVKAWLVPIWHHLHEAGLGTVSENFDGDAPFTPRACVAQAWSVAEVLEIIRIVGESV